MKVGLSSSSLYLPKEVAMHAFAVDFSQDPVVGFFSISERGIIPFQYVHLCVVFHVENLP